MTDKGWITVGGDGPIIATAIHAGHELRTEVEALTALSDAERFREEDPFTDQWLWGAETTVAVSRSRFEVDLNRPRESAVYIQPADAWGLELWKSELPPEVIDQSLAIYDDFYRDLEQLCDRAAELHPRFVVLDLHSYNHRRQGPDKPVDDPADNPEINVGTGTVDQSEWADVVAAFSNAMAIHPFDGGHLDVRENVRFKGGHMSRWINQRYEKRGCALAVEAKKIYMDEWTGEPVEGIVVNIGEAIASAMESVTEILG